MYIYVYTYFIHDTHIVFHISYIIPDVFLFPDVRRVDLFTSQTSSCWRIWISLKPRMDGTITQMNLAQNLLLGYLMGPRCWFAMLMVVRIWTFVHCQTLRKTQFVMCETNNVRYFRLFWWHLLESTLIQSGWFSCCFTECAFILIAGLSAPFGPEFPLRVHLLQLLSPSGLTSDEPVRNYMRSVQQAWEMDGNGRESCFFSWTNFFLGLFETIESLPVNLFLWCSSCSRREIR